MKKIFYSLIAVLLLLLVMPTVNAENEIQPRDGDGKVKVYIFEAIGCPYCEKQVEFLEGLSSYGEKFEIVRKEAYLDHGPDWNHGSDYDLTVQVADAFNNKGFEDATYNGTPLVVISNLYAKTAYSEDLESYINEAYEAGDVDIVGCFENGETDCESRINGTTSKKEDSGVTNTIIIIGIISVVILGCAGLVVVSVKQK